VRDHETIPMFGDEWEGMPEFHQENRQAVRKLTVSFDTLEDYENFGRLVGQTLTPHTDTIWYPEMTRNQLDGVKRYGPSLPSGLTILWLWRNPRPRNTRPRHRLRCSYSIRHTSHPMTPVTMAGLQTLVRGRPETSLGTMRCGLVPQAIGSWMTTSPGSIV
jgi:hypothetical protein